MFVETNGLTKRYGAFTALNDCSFGVERGEVFGLLGPNGAGKTTLLRLLMGFLKPSAGWSKIDGLDCHAHSVEVHQRLAYLPGDARMFRQMRGKAALRFFAEVRPDGDLQKSLELAERLELDLSRRVSFMSTGMRQKLALATMLATSAPLLILDEPTANLDPTVRHAVIDMVAEARDAGRTVMFSSHVLSEVEDVCDRVVILRAGKLVHTQVMSELRRQHLIRAQLEGPLPSVPDHFVDHLSIAPDGKDGVLIETSEELSPLLEWLGTLALKEVRIEPLGLRSIYKRFHAANESKSRANEAVPETAAVTSK